ncbi:MAG TPA: hypothetical protein VM890_01280 [Longimicrobium sp.]|nr:hypothetical protein [Longimicrobium sp.]
MSALPPPAPAARDARNPLLGAALAAAAGGIPPERVEQVWLFPPRRVGAKESGLAVLVVTAQDDADAGRTIWTVRYDAETGKGGKVEAAHALEEQGTVPPDRVGRIVDGVVRRLEAESDAPDVRELAGDPAAWRALLAELGAPLPVDAGNGE